MRRNAGVVGFQLACCSISWRQPFLSRPWRAQQLAGNHRLPARKEVGKLRLGSARADTRMRVRSVPASPCNWERLRIWTVILAALRVIKVTRT